MADDPTNTTSSGSMDIPQATLSNATNTPTTNTIETTNNGNIKIESSGGNLVMEEFNKIDSFMLYVGKKHVKKR